MKISIQQQESTRFFVNLCSIIGGVFVLFGLLNRFLVSCADSF